MGSLSSKCRACLFLTILLFTAKGLLADPGEGLQFIENKAQWPAPYQYGARIPGGSLFVQPGAFTYYFFDASRIEQLHEASHSGREMDSPGPRMVDGVRIQTKFLGARTTVAAQGLDVADAYYNFYNGTDTCSWASGVQSFGGLLYNDLYAGIDLKVYAAGRNLKYDFIVAPGTSPETIRFSYDGVGAAVLNNAGDIEVADAWDLFIEKKPVAFQNIGGERIQVACEYQLIDGVFSFRFPDGYDSCEELIIDPLIIFSTYSGSTADNWGSTATPGEHGTLYSAGVTWHLYGGRFPATNGAFQTSYAGAMDVGILKYDSTGTQLLYASYLGGEETDSPHSLVVNQDNELIVLGTTSSTDFPTGPNAFDRPFSGGEFVYTVIDYVNGSDIFVARISADGRQLMGSTLLGGAENDGINNSILVQNYGDQQRGDVITDHDNNIYISTVTASPEFPIVSGLYTTYGGGATDGVVIKMTPDLSTILWSTFLGGNEADACHTIQFDASGNLFVAGGTASHNFPTTADAYQKTFNGIADGWIANVSADGAALLHATLTGTDSFDEIFFVDLNASDEVYVYGQTSGAFPVTPGVYSNPNSGQFVQKFSHDLSSLVFSTVIGSGRGIPDISPTAFLVNDCNNIYLAGWGGVINIANLGWQNNTFGMPVTPDAYQPNTSGSDFYFMVLTDDATEFLYGTYLGGNLSRTHVDGGTSRFDKSGIVYQAVCAGCAASNAVNMPTSDFPTTPGVWSRINRSQNCNNAAFKFDLSSLKARLQSNSVALNHPGLDKICIPDPIVFQNFSTGGERFEWNLGDGTKLVKFDTSMVVHQYKQTGQYTVWLKAIDRGTCRVVDSASVKVNVFIADIRVQDDGELCLHDRYTLQASGGASYFWRSADNTFQSSVQYPVVSPADTTLYIVRVTEASGCIMEDSVQINVIPSLVPGFEWTQEGECTGLPRVTVTNTTDSLWADDRMYFDFGDGATSDLPEVTHAFEKDGVLNVKLIAIRSSCVNEKTVPLPIFRMLVPNVITPGSKDGKNDHFTIQYGPGEGVTPASFGLRSQVTIYNRWGVEVFKSDDYQYDWDGDGLDGGVYYYEVSLENHATCKSWIHLIK